LSGAPVGTVAVTPRGDVSPPPGTVLAVKVFSPEFSVLVRRVARVAAPLAGIGAVVCAAAVVVLTLRHRSRVRRGLVHPSSKRYRIAPIP